MKNATKIIASVVGFVTLLFQLPQVQSAVAGFFTSHPSVSALFGGLLTIAALFHNPKS